MFKKILILGGARFHGLQLAEHFCKAGNKVYVLNRGRYKSHYDSNINHLIADRNDIKSFKKVLDNRDFDVIIDNNAYTPTQVILISEIIKNNCNHYVFTSSASVYLKLYSRHRLKEEESTGIQDGLFNSKIIDYALGKFASENVIRELKKDHTILRFPTIFGEGDFVGKLNHLDKKLKNNGKIVLEKEIDRFSLIYVKDVVKVFEKILDNEKCFEKTINFADPVLYTFDKFFKSIYKDKYSKDNLVLLPAQEIWKLKDSFPFVWSPPISTSLSEKLLGKLKCTTIQEWGPRTLEWEIKNLNAL